MLRWIALIHDQLIERIPCAEAIGTVISPGGAGSSAAADNNGSLAVLGTVDDDVITILNPLI
jgi:hypothetical protein